MTQVRLAAVRYWLVAATSPEILVDTHLARRQQVAALTGLRGFAALAVMVVHSTVLTAFPWLGFHTYGPIALFTLSGFLLFQPWSRWLLGLSERPDIRRFAHRRFWRIFPPYLVVALLVMAIHTPTRPGDAGSWIRNLTLTHIYVQGDLQRELNHTWSLATELSWYVALPLGGLAVGLVLKRFLYSPTTAVVVVAVLAIALSLAWKVWIYESVTSLSWRYRMLMWLPAYAACFAGGALLGHLSISAAAQRRARMIMAWGARHQVLVLTGALACGVLGASRLGGPWDFVTRHALSEQLVRFGGMTGMALLLLFAVAASPSESIPDRLFGNRVMQAIGRWSYGLYLWHIPVILALVEVTQIRSGLGGLVLWLGLVALCAIPLAAATYHFVERPAMAWAGRIPPAR